MSTGECGDSAVPRKALRSPVEWLRGNNDLTLDGPISGACRVQIFEVEVSSLVALLSAAPRKQNLAFFQYSYVAQCMLRHWQGVDQTAIRSDIDKYRPKEPKDLAPTQLPIYLPIRINKLVRNSAQ